MVSEPELDHTGRRAVQPPTELLVELLRAFIIRYRDDYDLELHVDSRDARVASVVVTQTQELSMSTASVRIKRTGRYFRSTKPLTKSEVKGVNPGIEKFDFKGSVYD